MQVTSRRAFLLPESKKQKSILEFWNISHYIVTHNNNYYYYYFYFSHSQYKYVIFGTLRGHYTGLVQVVKLHQPTKYKLNPSCIWGKFTISAVT